MANACARGAAGSRRGHCCRPGAQRTFSKTEKPPGLPDAETGHVWAEAQRERSPDRIKAARCARRTAGKSASLQLGGRPEPWTAHELRRDASRGASRRAPRLRPWALAETRAGRILLPHPRACGPEQCPRLSEPPLVTRKLERHPAPVPSPRTRGRNRDGHPPSATPTGRVLSPHRDPRAEFTTSPSPQCGARVRTPVHRTPEPRPG